MSWNPWQIRHALLIVLFTILNGQHGRLIILAAFKDYNPSICLIVFTQEKKNELWSTRCIKKTLQTKQSETEDTYLLIICLRTWRERKLIYSNKIDAMLQKSEENTDATMQLKLTCGEVFAERACCLEQLFKMGLAVKNPIHGGVAAHLKLAQFNISSCIKI